MVAIVQWERSGIVVSSHDGQANKKEDGEEGQKKIGVVGSTG